MSFSAAFNNLQPKTKRIVMAVSAIVMVFGVSWVLASMTERKASKNPRAERPEVTVVSPARTTGVESFAAKMSLLEKTQQEQATKLERALKAAEKIPPTKSDGLSEIDAKGAAEPEIPPLASATSVFDAPASKPPTLPPPPVNAPLAGPIAKPESPPPDTNSTGSGTSPDSTTKTIHVIGESGEVAVPKADEKSAAATAVKNSNPKRSDSAFIPAGSMFTGVLLNGLDAATSSVAQKNPTPVVIRVKREALLPNFAAIDVRECFLLAAGYGQLSTERALMRAESLSCVRGDGQVIEAKVDAFIVGSDGKVGIPGRLVSKQGQMIAQSLLAGALGGIGQSLTRSRVPSLNINPGLDQNIYQADSLSTIAQGGLAGGIASSTNMIAKFYLDMAKETFPVVEIAAGEVATVMITRGTSLPLMGSTSLQKYVDPNERQHGFGGNSANQQEKKPAQPIQDQSANGIGVANPLAAAITSGAKNVKPSFKNGLGW